MKTIGIFYATLTKTTVGIVDEIEFFLKKDAELYLEPDDVKQNAYEIFNRNGDLLNPIILKKSKKFLFGTFVKESIQIMPYIPNINNKEYLLELLFKFCDNVKIEVPKGINLNNLVDRLIKEIGFTK